MFRKYAPVFAATVLLGATVLMARDVAGSYAADTPQGPLVIELHRQQNRLGGAFQFQGSNLPLIANQNGDKIQGLFKGKNGLTYPFTGSFDASGALTLNMLGKSYQFRQQGATDQAPEPPAPAAKAPQNTPAQNAPAAANPLDAPAAPTTGPSATAAPPTAVPSAGIPDIARLQTHQGKSLACDIPPGWSFFDTNNGVDTASPDGMTQMHRTFLRSMGRNSPDMLLRQSAAAWPKFGISDVKILSTKVISAQSKLYEMDYLQRGRPAHAIVQATVQYGPAGGYLANMVTLQSSRESFQQYLPLLVAMSKSVRVTDPDQFADAGKFRDESLKRNQIAAQSAKDIGDIYINGEAARSKVREEGNKGADDTLRSATRFKDSDGREYVGPLQATRAFKHPDGTVTFSSDITAPVPADAVEIPPYDYSGK